MITIVYETFYNSDQEYICILTKKDCPDQSRKVRLLCPGSQYLPTIRELFDSRGFTMHILEAR